MKFFDFLPPTDPSLKQQRDALQKGLGRVAQWATAGKLDTEQLLDACLHDLRYDKQCETNRGDWLWNLISISGLTQRFHDPVLMGLRTVTDAGDADQLSQIAVQFAQNGKEEFRTQLYEFIRQRRIPDSPDIGEMELLRLDGERAFAFLAQLQGRLLASRNWNWEWDDTYFIDRMIGYLGKPRVRELLTESLDPEIRRFTSTWLENASSPTTPHKPKSKQQTHVQRMQSITLNDVNDAIRTEHNCYWLRGWGMYANEQSLNAVLEQLWVEQDPIVIVKLLRVFSNRPVPVVDTRLIELCKHDDVEVRRRALSAMERNSHPLIRSFALSELIERNLDQPVVGLFIKNFESGDEQRLLDHVELPEDPCQLHWMLMDVIKILETNESAESLKLAQIVYFHTPCQNCRFDAARLLFRQGHMPTWMLEECRSDAEAKCRPLVEPNGEHDEKNKS